MTFFTKKTSPSAHLSDNHLVLSLPDAMTPVVWMIDTDKTGSFFMRVDKDDNGLHILQKIEGSGKDIKIEDVAYYAEQEGALRAMMMIGKILDSSAHAPKSTTTLKTINILLGGIGLAAILFVAFTTIQHLNIGASDNRQNAGISMPLVNEDPDAVGVPLSADDFLSNKQQFALPF